MKSGPRESDASCAWCRLATEMCLTTSRALHLYNFVNHMRSRVTTKTIGVPIALVDMVKMQPLKS